MKNMLPLPPGISVTNYGNSTPRHIMKPSLKPYEKLPLPPGMSPIPSASPHSAGASPQANFEPSFRYGFPRIRIIPDIFWLQFIY